MNDYEINQDDMYKSATELERLLDKYRHQPEIVDGKETWSEEVQKAYDALIGYINRAKNGEIKEPINDYMRSSGYFIYETPVDKVYPDLSEVYSTFCLDIQGCKRGKVGQEMKLIIQAAREKAMKIRRERGLD